MSRFAIGVPLVQSSELSLVSQFISGLPPIDFYSPPAVGVEPETRLRALRWYISKKLEPQESARVLRDSSFLVRTTDSLETHSLLPCRVHTAIEVIAQAQVCDLILVLA
jgi:hypothetical protein